ncbi:MAG: preprotein translocase subunit SecE [Spirochaetes bacterium]|nr:preprotein translocase subunit SecE [Spirochaetota bacterium]
MKQIIEYLKGSHEEMKKISWPNRDEVSRFTFVTIVTVFIVAMILWVMDTVLMQLISLVMK